jgi:hypothetical protein
MEQQLTAEQQLRAVKLVSASIVMGVLLEAAIGVFLSLNIPPSVEPGLANILGALFLVAGFIAVAISFVVRGALRNSPAANKIAVKMRATIVAMAIAEVPAILGLVHALISGKLAFAAVLWVIAIVASVLHFPRNDWLEGK